MNFTDLTGLFGAASVITAATLLLPPVKKMGSQKRVIVQCAVFALALIPFTGLSFAAYLRGGIGDVSITTLLLLWCALIRAGAPSPSHGGRAQRGGNWDGGRNCMQTKISTPTLAPPLHGGGNKFALFAFLALAALLLYPMALGLGKFDPYQLGYGNAAFLFAVLLIALLAWWRKAYWVAVSIACATLAWSFGWYESTNLWDYLLDPFVEGYALVVTVKKAWKVAVVRL